MKFIRIAFLFSSALSLSQGTTAATTYTCPVPSHITWTLAHGYWNGTASSPSLAVPFESVVIPSSDTIGGHAPTLQSANRGTYAPIAPGTAPVFRCYYTGSNFIPPLQEGIMQITPSQATPNEPNCVLTPATTGLICN